MSLILVRLLISVFIRMDWCTFHRLTDKKFVKHPLEVVSVGDIVEVKVLSSVDMQKKRIQLSMIL